MRTEKYDVFISHASEDKADVARPLAALLMQAGLRVWLDEFEMRLGDSLRRKIDAGLSSSEFGIVVLSKAFFCKEWPKKELDALVAREAGQAKVILPIWHNVSSDEIRVFSPLLADRLGASTHNGIPKVAGLVIDAIRHSGVKSLALSSPLAEHGPQTASIQDLIVKFLDELQERADSPSEITGIPSGFYDLDRLLGGFSPGELYVLCARPSMGSTTLALNIAQHIANDEALPVMYVSSTLPTTGFTNRLVASAGRIHRAHLASGMLTDEEWPRLTDAIERMRDISIYFEGGQNISLPQLLERTRGVAARTGKLALTVVDNIDSLAGVESVEEHGRALRSLRELARELGCAVLAITVCITDRREAY